MFLCILTILSCLFHYIVDVNDRQQGPLSFRSSFCQKPLPGASCQCLMTNNLVMGLLETRMGGLRRKLNSTVNMRQRFMLVQAAKQCNVIVKLGI
jgi:hypothetical protein